MYDLIVIGGGPAGAAAAITAARRGARVVLLERGRYPRQKVCGEFVSAEARGILAALVAETSLFSSAPHIRGARLFLDGRVFAAAIDPPAASISRLDLDAALWRAAEACGVECCQQTAAGAINANANHFEVVTPSRVLQAGAVIDASGRWSNLKPAGHHRDRGWLGLKAHFAADNAPETTDLYFFQGGYCGVQPAGPGCVNVCAMVRAEVATTLEQVLACHPRLAEASREWRAAMETVATSPLLFRRPTPDRNGVLCVGDAAGFIDPFVGDGIALALRSGVHTAALLCAADGDVRRAVEQYRVDYARQFTQAFRMAATLRRLMSLPAFARAPFLPLLNISAVSRFLVKRTRAAADGLI